MAVKILRKNHSVKKFLRRVTEGRQLYAECKLELRSLTLIQKRMEFMAGFSPSWSKKLIKLDSTGPVVKRQTFKCDRFAESWKEEGQVKYRRKFCKPGLSHTHCRTDEDLGMSKSFYVSCVINLLRASWISCFCCSYPKVAPVCHFSSG